MRCFAVVDAGLEQFAASELSELAGVDVLNAVGGVVVFDSNPEKICLVAYRSQSISRLCGFVCEFPVKPSLAVSIASFKKAIGSFDFGFWSDGASFVVECSREGNHDFNSLDFATAANEVISGLAGKVSSFKSPSLRLYCFINGDSAFFGVDVAGFDLGKRDYRIFGHSSDLRACAAYALVRLSGFSPKFVLLDPFSRSGAISVEAALFASGFPVNHYRRDSFMLRNLKPFSLCAEKVFASADRKAKSGRLKIFSFSPLIAHVRTCEKNAKIAGVNRLISFARVDLEWLELKFDKGSVECIVSFPPMLSRRSSDSDVRKVYSELFYQASLLLSKNGKVVLAGRDESLLAEAASNNGFVLSVCFNFPMGADAVLASVFVRK